jgi:hypothetical protein
MPPPNISERAKASPLKSKVLPSLVVTPELRANGEADVDFGSLRSGSTTPPLVFRYAASEPTPITPAGARPAAKATPPIAKAQSKTLIADTFIADRNELGTPPKTGCLRESETSGVTN